MPYNLNSIFSAVIFKTLVQVDLPGGSNQHEINGVRAVREFFETAEPISGAIRWHYFSDDSDSLRDTDTFTFYDARAENPIRTEWRMYYYGDFLRCAQPGDVLVLARTLSGEIFGLIFQNNSSWLRIAQALFQFENATPGMQLISSENLESQELELAKRQILDELGIEISIPSMEDDDEIAVNELTAAREANRDFPSTSRMAQLAQSLVDVDFQNADEALLAFIDREERIFRAIEKILVAEKLAEGFASVDDFIGYSLSVQNRRKARMGFALQNHLSRIFTARQLRFDAQVVTEIRNKPDFIFPGIREYRDATFDSELLIMLAAKSSLKDRWRQILDEAERIPNKHLCTLERAISVDQTRTMSARNVTLVIPSAFHSTYTEAQQTDLWSINRFIEYVRDLQTR